jgi:hypothetical protein
MGVGWQVLTAFILSCCRCLVLVPGCRESVVVCRVLVVDCLFRLSLRFFSLSVPISAFTQSNLAPISHTQREITPVHTAKKLPQTGT